MSNTLAKDVLEEKIDWNIEEAEWQERRAKEFQDQAHSLLQEAQQHRSNADSLRHTLAALA